MAGKRTLEERLAALHALRANPTTDAAIAALHQALADKSNHLVAEAARIVGESEIAQLESDLVRAFERFMIDPLKTDKGCRAKAAIAEALYRIGSTQEELFLQGVRYVQLEPTYGGREDTAANLRGVCALGLVRANYPHVMVELAHLLADQESDARIAAARAIAYAQQDAGVPLLHFKALSGDQDPQVMLACFDALLRLSPELSLPFAAGFLRCDDLAVGEAAAMALGESRIEEALGFLVAAWEEVLDPDFRRTVLVAIALLRHEEAIAFLLSLLADGSPAVASAAIEALGMYRQDDNVWQRVRQLAGEREDVEYE
jgi:HEAT repeat protein